MNIKALETYKCSLIFFMKIFEAKFKRLYILKRYNIKSPIKSCAY